MQNEIWKDVPGYSGLYQVSNLGRVKSIERYDAKKHRVKERILKQANRGNGYKVVVLFSNGHKMYAVHRLVALAFIPNPDGLPQINHKNEIKTDNRAENLEWCTPKQNANVGTVRERISESRKKSLRCKEDAEKRKRPILQYDLMGNIIRRYDSISEAKKANGIPVNNGSINACLKGKLKTAYNYVWRYDRQINIDQDSVLQGVTRKKR